MVLHHVSVGGKIFAGHPDVVPYFLPNFCFLGRSLTEGVIPGWNPHAMAGIPFTGDPQSGWMYAPAMLLFSVFDCATAIRVFFVMQPALAGVGVYAFLRVEGLSRTASTVAGLVLALPIAGSTMSMSLPLDGALAWTCVTLAFAARTYHSTTRFARLSFGLLTALALGQVAAAHLSNGLATATAVLVVYWVVRSRADRATRPLRRSLLHLAALLGGFVLVNLAYFLPRLAYLPRSTLALGYERLEQLATELVGGGGGGVAEFARPLRTSWILTLVTYPGAFLGGIALISVVAAAANKRHRPLFRTFAGVAAFSYVFGLSAVARFLEPVALKVPFGEFYIHDPSRLRYPFVLGLAVLAGIGIDAWVRDLDRVWRARCFVVAVVVGIALPIPFGAAPVAVVAPAIALGLGFALLSIVVGRPRLSGWIAPAVAAELVVVGLLSFGAPPDREGGRLFVTNPTTPLDLAVVDAGAYTEALPIMETLQRQDEARFASVLPSEFGQNAYLFEQTPRFWPLESNQRGMIFGVDDAQGYNPAQVRRYWRFIREVNRVRTRYTLSVLMGAPARAFDTLGIDHVITESGSSPLPRLDPRRHYRPVTLNARDIERVELSDEWTVARSADEALNLALSSDEVILEAEPRGLTSTGDGAGRADYDEVDSQTLRVRVSTASPALLVVRNVFDPNWTATIDGEEAELLRADYLMQAVVVPEGDHLVELAYRDPWVGRGLLGSALAVSIILAVAFYTRRARDRGPTESRQER